MTHMLRLAAAATALLSLGGCVVETPAAPARPAPVVLQPTPSTGTVVVQPQP